MSEIRTNRDLYLSVVALAKQVGGMPLEEFLARFQVAAKSLSNRQEFACDQFVACLERAILGREGPVDEQAVAVEGFIRWSALVDRQVEQVMELRREGWVGNVRGYLRGASMNGEVWFNLHTASFLEGAVAGTWGGWSPGDPHRLPIDSSVQADPVIELGLLSWEDLIRFIQAGQDYE